MHSIKDNYIVWDGRSSKDYGIIVKRNPAIIRPSRKVDSYNLAGRNGDIYIMQDAWNNYIQPYELFLGDGEENSVPEAYMELSEWLNIDNHVLTVEDYNNLTVHGYRQLFDSYEPNHIRLAVLTQEHTIENKRGFFGDITISFNCRPERFRLDAFEPVEVGNIDAIDVGNYVSFYNGQNYDIYAYIQPSKTQTGSGTPSPDNVRPIPRLTSVYYTNTGNTGSETYEMTLDLSFYSFYGGKVEDGLVSNWYFGYESTTVGDSGWTFGTANGINYISKEISGKLSAKAEDYLSEIVCSMLPSGGWIQDVDTITDKYIYQTDDLIILTDRSCNSLEDFYTKYGDAQIVYPIPLSDSPVNGDGNEDIEEYDGENTLFTAMGQMGIHTSGMGIFNPTKQIAKPVFVFYGAGNSSSTTVKINDVEIKFPYGLRNSTKPLYFDSENQNFYFTIATNPANVPERYLDVSLDSFPTLKTGFNPIYVTGNAFSKIEVIPRWWDL